MTQAVSNTFLSAQNGYKRSSYEAKQAEQNLNKACATLYAFEQGSSWKGAGADGDFATHDSLRADFLAAQAALKTANAAFETSKSTYNQQKSSNPDLANKFDQIA